MSETETTGTSMVPITEAQIPAAYLDPEQVDGMIEKIERQARDEAKGLTLDSRKGREAIASLAYRVARAKTTLDTAGKAMTEKQRAEIEQVNLERAKIRDRLDALKAEIRKPLDEWEAAEERRLAELTGALEAIQAIRPAATAAEIAAQIEGLATAPMTEERWLEYLDIAQVHHKAAIQRLTEALAAQRKYEADQAELARLRAEAAARAEREAEAARQAEAERLEIERLAAEAERKAQAEADRRAENERAAREAEERVRAEAEAAARAAAERETELERQRLAAEARHAAELADAEARVQAAAQADRDRIEAERRAADEARIKREADQAHRDRILRDITEALMPIPRERIPLALMDSRIPHVTIRL